MLYFDNNSTTHVSEEVFAEMLPFLQNHYGNPSSPHKWGKENRQAIENARCKVANLLGVTSDEIYFTCGATEANNTIIKGVAYAYKDKGNHIVTSAIEHPSILRSCEFLAQNGYEVTYLPVDRYGLVSLESLQNAIRKNTILVSIMHSNNEVGTLQPIVELAKFTKSKNIFFHTDVAQSIGKEFIHAKQLGVDMVTLAGHKFHAPKGIGAFYISKDIHFEPLLHGTGHERGKRAGTENLPFCVALGKACEIVHTNLHTYAPHIQEVRDLLWQEIKKSVPQAILNGHPEKRLVNTLNVSFPGFIGAEILNRIPDLAVSTGAACNKKPGSFVLKAMNIDDKIAQGSIRFSLSKYNTKEEALLVSKLIASTIKSL